MHHYGCTGTGMSYQTPDLKTLYIVKYREIYDPHCVNSFGKGLNVLDVHLYVKVPHSSFKDIISRYKISNIGHLSLKRLALAFSKASVQPPYTHSCPSLWRSEPIFLLYATCNICYVYWVKLFAKVWEHRCNFNSAEVIVGFGIAI